MPEKYDKSADYKNDARQPQVKQNDDLLQDQGDERVTAHENLADSNPIFSSDQTFIAD